MIYTGYCCIMTDSSTLYYYVNGADYDAINIDHIKEFLSSRFHAYWSNFKALYISDPVDMNAPTNAVAPVSLDWHVSLKEKNTGIYRSEIIYVSFHCVFCNKETSSYIKPGQL